MENVCKTKGKKKGGIFALKLEKRASLERFNAGELGRRHSHKEMLDHGRRGGRKKSVKDGG